MISSGADSCLPEPVPPWVLHGPYRPSLLRIKVVVIVIVLTFAGLLLLLGYDLQAALTSSLAAVLAAGEVARRILGTR
jgi:ABC-type glucose/galactose transport system permease subunit